MKKVLKGILLIFTLLFSFTLLTGCVEVEDGENKEKDQKAQKENIKLGDTFEFDDLEITLGKEITFTKIDNEYSEKNGKDVVKLPITVKNLKNETHSLNMFYYKIYGAGGTELDTVNTYFDDDNIDLAGDLRTGASYTKYIYFLYDADGTYAIEFSQFLSDKITIEFEVKK